jgi:hypothetical protein
VAAVVVAFGVLFAFLFGFAIAKLNFQKRWQVNGYKNHCLERSCISWVTTMSRYVHTVWPHGVV